jgi:hypothetical protein
MSVLTEMARIAIDDIITAQATLAYVSHFILTIVTCRDWYIQEMSQHVQ